MPNSSRTAVHHHKRHGHHQKRTKHFLQTYAPYVPLLLIVLTGLAFTSYWKPRTAHAGVLAYATEMSSSALLSGTNQQRINNGLPSLNINSKLASAAQAKANDMASRNYWSHNTPEGNPPWVFITNAGYSYTTAGENLAYGYNTSSDTIAAWMASQGHRDNILKSSYTEVGFGFTNAPSYTGADSSPHPQTIVVAMYASPYVAPAPAPKPVPTTPAPKSAAVKSAPISASTNASSTPVNPADPGNTLKVVVIDENNKPVVGASVTVHSTPRTAATDDTGTATFANVENAQHSITIDYQGKTSETPIDLSAATKEMSVTILKPGSAATTTAGTTNQLLTNSPRSVSRLEVMTRGSIPWLSSFVAILALSAGALLAVKHGFNLQRLVMNGERYVLQHALFDITLVSLLGLCFIVTRSAGIIL